MLIMKSGITKDGNAYYLEYRKMTAQDFVAGMDFWCDTIGGPIHGTIIRIDADEDAVVFTIEGRDGMFAMQMKEVVGYFKKMV